MYGDPSPDVIAALVWCGATVRQSSGQAAVRDLVVDGYRLTVAAKEIPQHDPRRYVYRMIFSVLIRVDALGARRNGLAQGDDLDRWLYRQEQAIDALITPVDGHVPPFGEKQRRWHLSIDMDQVTPGSPGHAFTVGRHRLVQWSIDQPWWLKEGMDGHLP